MVEAKTRSRSQSQERADEFISSEARFHHDMAVMVKQYQHHRPQLSKLLNKSDLKKFDAHMKPYQRLVDDPLMEASGQETNIQSVVMHLYHDIVTDGAKFQKSLDSLSEATNNTLDLNTFIQKIEKNPKVKKLLQSDWAPNERLFFRDYASKSFQRLTKYPLLLRDLTKDVDKELDKGSHLHQKLASIAKVVKKQADKTNRQGSIDELHSVSDFFDHSELPAIMDDNPSAMKAEIDGAKTAITTLKTKHQESAWAARKWGNADIKKEAMKIFKDLAGKIRAHDYDYALKTPLTLQQNRLDALSDNKYWSIELPTIENTQDPILEKLLAKNIHKAEQAVKDLDSGELPEFLMSDYISKGKGLLSLMKMDINASNAALATENKASEQLSASEAAPQQMAAKFLLALREVALQQKPRFHDPMFTIAKLPQETVELLKTIAASDDPWPKAQVERIFDQAAELHQQVSEYQQKDFQQEGRVHYKFFKEYNKNTRDVLKEFHSLDSEAALEHRGPSTPTAAK